jgi:uncharacterized membrane protein
MEHHLWIERGAFAVESLAILLIIGCSVLATLDWLYRVVIARQPRIEEYNRYRHRLARSLLLGLELLVAADIIRTVALEATLVTIAQLGFLVVVRTFLSWSIVVEIEGRWPWQPPRKEEKAEEVST